MFKLFRDKSPRLGRSNIELGEFIAGYRCCSPLFIQGSDVVYIASRHIVQLRVLIPDGPQGFSEIPVPQTVKTRDALLRFLADSGIVTLKTG